MRWWLALAVGCGGDDDGSGHSGTTPTTPTGTCAASATDALGAAPDFDGASGELVVRELGPYSTLSGAFLDRPPVDLHVEADRRGQCRLVTYTPTTCTPSCVAGTELCVGGTCVTQERVQRAGALTLGGVSEPLTTDPDGTGRYWVMFDSAGGDATLEVAVGADVGAASASACHVGPVVPAEDWTALLGARADGADAELRWNNVNPEARVRVRMTTGVATHGGVAHAEIECEGPDTGSLVLPGPFLDELFREGWGCGECGNHELRRYRAGAIGDSGARLVQEAVTPFWFIPGRL
ncbi:MAG: hypothetical protein KC621_18495 [Myxococcales bacterium]|nr:hypothetical protein [Myxococcales bacterium]